MFRIKLLLCYSLIDTNTIPFYFSLSQIGRVESHTRRFGLTVLFRRILLTLRQLYHRAPSRPSVSPCPMGGASTSNSLKPQLVQAELHTRRVPIAISCTIERKGIDRVLNNTVVRKTY